MKKPQVEKHTWKVVAIIAVIASVGVTFANNDIDLEGAYNHALNTQKQALESTREAYVSRCIAEKNFAVDKLIKHWEGVDVATDEEVNRWTSKGKWTCDYSEAVFR